HPGGTQARGPHGAQPRDWRTDPDQGQQEGGLPTRQRAQGSSLTRKRTSASHPSAAEAKAADGFVFRSALRAVGLEHTSEAAGGTVAAGGSIQEDSGLPQGPAGAFQYILRLL